MPTYAYFCKPCRKEFEVFQSMKDDPLTTCPLCERKGQVQRLISGGAGIIFKGSGFYQTDYKNTRSGSAGGEGGSASKEGGAGSSTTTETAKGKTAPAAEKASAKSPKTD